MNHYGTIKRFLYIWILYWFLYFIQPVTSIYPNIFEAFILQVTFVFCTTIFFIIGSSSKSHDYAVNISIFDTLNATFVVRSGIFISII